MRAKFGDIIEIETSKGYVYSQYTHEAELHGSLIRVFDLFHQKRPSDLIGLTREPIRFSTFFPLNAALRQRVVERIGNAHISTSIRKFPLFRYGIPHPLTRKVEVWYFWNGKRYCKIGVLTESVKKLSIVGIFDFEFLKNALEEGWRPEIDQR